MQEAAGREGEIDLAQNPGLLKAALQRHGASDSFGNSLGHEERGQDGATCLHTRGRTPVPKRKLCHLARDEPSSALHVEPQLFIQTTSQS